MQKGIARKRARPRGRKSQSPWQLGATDQQNSSSATTQSGREWMDEMALLLHARARLSNPASEIPNLERQNSGSHFEMTDAMNNSPAIVQDNRLPGDQHRTKRRLSQLNAPQESEASEPELDIAHMTERRPVKKPRIETNDDALRQAETPPSCVPRKRSTNVKLTPHEKLSPSPSSSASSQDQSPPAAFPQGCDEANVGINAMMVNMGKGFFSIRRTSIPSPFVRGSYNEEASSPASSRKTFFEQFISFTEICKKMFQDCKAMVGGLPNQELQEVEERLEEMGAELSDVTKVVGKTNKKNERLN